MRVAAKFMSVGLWAVAGGVAFPAVAQGTAISVPAGVAADPAAAPVQALATALIDAMRGGRKLGFQGRTALLAPVVSRSFDLPLMTRLVIGPPWAQLGTADQAAITAAFSRFTIAQYANNFSGFSGQSFALADKVESRGTDRLVRTTLVQPGKPGIPIGYRLRGSAGQWRIVDVFYNNAISQVATRRADLASILAAKGASGLVAHLDSLTAKAAN
jgi:phospholipid transport system substrate-binding protein